MAIFLEKLKLVYFSIFIFFIPFCVVKVDSKCNKDVIKNFFFHFV